jgi:hypothetical protein
MQGPNGQRQRQDYLIACRENGLEKRVADFKIIKFLSILEVLAIQDSALCFLGSRHD